MTDPIGLAEREPRRRPGRSTTHGPRPPCASCCARSVRTPTARACARPPPGWPGRTPSSPPGCGRRREDVLTTTFDLGHDEMVLVRDIELWSMCEHHLVPFTGVAHVGYIPAETGKITGLSKLARLVDVYAKRPQVQERLTTQVADALMRILEARGVIVVIEAEHLCMTMRGVRKAGARTITSAVRGIMHHAATRAEAMALISSRPLRPLTPGLAQLRTARRLMGVVNVTPDSFSDGGRWATPPPRSRTGASCWPTGPTSSTSAASPPARAPPARWSPRSSAASSR